VVLRCCCWDGCCGGAAASAEESAGFACATSTGSGCGSSVMASVDIVGGARGAMGAVRKEPAT
jgi:hypothetical protein